MEMFFVAFGMGAAYSRTTIAGPCACLRRLLLPTTPSVSGAHMVQLSWDSQNACCVPGPWLDAAEAEAAV